MKQQLKDFYTALKAGFNPTYPIKAWFNGFPPQTSGVSPYLAFILDKGNLTRETFSSSKKEINALVFIGVNKDLDYQDKLVLYVDELDEFFRLNPRLGGVDMIELNDFDFSFEQTSGAGLLLCQILITIQEN